MMSALDGLTLLRYGHVYDAGGGMEQYLSDLNAILHSRNDMQVVQLQLTSDARSNAESEEGRVKKVSLYVSQESHEKAVRGSGGVSHLVDPVKQWIRDRILSAPGIYSHLTKKFFSRQPQARRDGEPNGAGEAVRSLHRQHAFDLICLHTIGGADTAEIIAVARQERIPVVYIHHFANDRLAALSVRLQLENVVGVAGVCNVEVPAFLEGRFEAVLDGIDTEFFARSASTRSVPVVSRPMIFLPARITPAKGQADLIRAAGELRRRGVDLQVIFAGRTDDTAYAVELKRLVEREKLTGHVNFVGQQSPTQLRDWYCAAQLVVFPTRHHEGLPRILLEGQAMEVPPIVYNAGGARSGLRDGVTGYLVPQGDLSTLTARMETLLRDEARRRTMATAARQFVEKEFSLSALGSRHEQYYLRALSREPVLRCI